ncbi:hypothetical protein TNCV_2320551 [Trichonephila clavipes]|nr:hypothetical protein TNCV_2320551 [Trichonephila clavipes]
MCMMTWFLLRWIDGATTAAREGCCSLCMARVTHEGGRFDLSTFCSGNEYVCDHAKTTVFETVLLTNITISTCHPSGIVVLQTAVPQGQGSNPGEDMDIYECIVPSRHGDTLNSCRAASPLVRSVEEEERWEASEPPRVFSL